MILTALRIHVFPCLLVFFLQAVIFSLKLVLRISQYSSRHRVRQSGIEEIRYLTQWTKIFLRVFLGLLIVGRHRVQQSVTEEIKYPTPWTKNFLRVFLYLFIIGSHKVRQSVIKEIRYPTQ
ncbi:hypothetical protein ACFX1R_027697 [Malus domestica]